MFYSKEDIKYIRLIHELCNNEYRANIFLSTALNISRNYLSSLQFICKRLNIITKESINGFEFIEENYNYWSLFGFSEHWEFLLESEKLQKKFEEKGVNFDELGCDD